MTRGNPQFKVNGSGAAYGEFRCKTWIKKRAKQCGNWRVRGSNYCKRHGAHRVGQLRMPRYYRDCFGKTLKERFEGLMDAPHREMLALYEELALTRAAAAESIKIASVALDASKTLEGKQLALSLINDACVAVGEMVERVSKVESISTDAVSMNVVDLFIQQICRAAYKACGDEHVDIAKRIEAEIFKLTSEPGKGVVATKLIGTAITPDQVVTDMDRTIGAQ